MNKEDVFKKVKFQWNELFAKEITEKIIWQRVAAGLCVLNIFLIFALLQVSTKSHVIPWIVEVDALGRAQASGPAQMTETTDERIIRAHLFNFVEMARSIIGDAEAMRRNFNRAYQLVTPEVKVFLNSYYQDNNPMESARTQSREVVLVSFLKETDKTYIVEWKEIIRDLSNKVIEESRYKGLFTISQSKQITKMKILENPNNPFGIVITGISWSRTM